MRGGIKGLASLSLAADGCGTDEVQWLAPVFLFFFSTLSVVGWVSVLCKKSPSATCKGSTFQAHPSLSITSQTRDYGWFGLMVVHHLDQRSYPTGRLGDHMGKPP